MKQIFNRCLGMLAVCCFLLVGISKAQSTGEPEKIKVEVIVRSLADSTPIAAADVIVRGKSQFTVTDDNGRVSWELIPIDSILLITAPGFFPEEVNALASEDKVTRVFLRPTIETRDRGYNVLYPVVQLPGARSTLNGHVYQQGNFSSFENGFQGMAAGVHAIQSSGNLNAYTSVLMRGMGTSIFGTEPLYVIDGIPVTSGSLGDGGGGIGNNFGYNTTPLAEFTPYDIQSVEFLKGGAATALYGGRGANGVVQVRTKRGLAGKTKLQVGFQAGATSPTNRLDLMNGTEYRNAMDIAYLRSFQYNPANANAPVPGRDYYLRNGSNQYLTSEVANSTNTEWMDEILRSGYHRQLDMSASGGNKLVRFFFGGNYTQAQGIQKNNQNDRLSVRFNTDITINPQFRFGSSLYFSFASGNLSPSGNSSLGGGFGDAQTIALPISPIRFDSRNQALNPYVAFNPYFNAYNGSNIALLQDLTHSNFERQVFRNLGNIYVETDVKKIPGLKFRADFGFDYYSNFDRGFRSNFTRLGRDVSLNNDSVLLPFSQASDNRSVFFNLNLNGLASYQRKSGHHAYRLFAGYHWQQITNTFNGIAAENFPSSFSQLVSFGSRFSGLPIGAETGFAFVNHFYGMDYAFRDRYFLNVSTAFTASTRFGADINFQSFPSLNLGWDLMKESFIPRFSWLHSARLQLGSSVVGNSLMTNTEASGYWKGNLPYIDPGQYPGRYPFSLSSRNLVPERNWVNEAELALGLLPEQKLQLRIGYFHRHTLNAAQYYPLPPSQGQAAPLFVKNGARIVNQGLELGLDAKVLKRADFEWKTTLNLATLAHRFASSDGLRADQTNAFLNTASVEGAGVSTFFLPRWAGFAPSDEPSGKWRAGDELILDANGNPFKPTSLEQIDAARVAIKDKSTLPKLYGGVFNQLTYKKIQLDFLFTFSLGNYVLDGGERFQSYMTGETNLRAGAQGQNLFFLRQDDTLLTYTNLLAQRNTTRFLHNASYVRLRNLGISYPLSFKSGALAKIKETRLFFRAQNLLTFTSFKGWDPEALANSQVNSSRALAHGNTFFDLPQFRSFLLGFTLTL